MPQPYSILHQWVLSELDLVHDVFCSQYHLQSEDLWEHASTGDLKRHVFFVQPFCWQTKIQLHISKGCLSRTFQTQNQQNHYQEVIFSEVLNAPISRSLNRRVWSQTSEVRNVGLNWEDLSWIVEEYNSLKAWGVFGRWWKIRWLEWKYLEGMFFLIFQCIMVNCGM